MALFKLSEEKLQESIETVGHNLLSNTFGGGMHSLDFKRWNFILNAINPLGFILQGALSVFGVRDKLDQAYFRQYYKIDSKVESQLKKMIKNIDDVAIFSSKNSYKKKGLTGALHGSRDFSGDETSVEDRTAMNTKRKANEVSLGTATAYHVLRFGDKFAIVFFIFDSNRIKEAKVVTAKDVRSTSYNVATISDFHKIKASEYTK